MDFNGDDKNWDTLDRINKLHGDIMSGIYKDFFTATNDAKEAAKKLINGGKTEPGSGKNMGNGKPDPVSHPDTESALKNAEDALNDAKSMLGELDAMRADFESKSYVNRSGAERSQSGPQTETQNAQAQPEEQKPAEPEEDPMETLDKLIGLESIKHDVKELTDFVKIQKLRQDQGLKSVPVSLHLVFTGNPGTGKTTVARILAKLYKQIGVLSKGQLVEVDRSGLVAGYVGQTALKTQEQITKALGGVLFIDEAYALSQKDDAFGQEAIDTILKAMEDHRDDLVVIVAGYTGPMEEFINSNPGLKSRFNKYIEFTDYSVDELEAIFDMNCKKYDYQVEEEAKKQVRALIVQRKLEKPENFANAREVRNLFEEIITNQARRVAAMEDPTQDDMMTIALQDLCEEVESVAAPATEMAESAENAEETAAETAETAENAGETKEGSSEEA